MTEETKPLEEKLNDMLGAAYDDAVKEDVVEDKSDDKPEAKESEKKETKPRAKDGKFAAKEADVKEDKAVEPEVAPAETPDQSVVDTEVVAPVSKAPDHWSAGAKAMWDKLDPVVRAEALKQVEFANKLQSRHAMERKKYESIEQVLEPQRNMLRAQYGDEARGLQQLFALSDFATKDPRGFIQYYAQQRGIDLRGLVQNAQPQQAVDPTITALQQQLQHAMQQINGIEQTNKQALISEVDRSYNEFASNPANKYIEEAKEDMIFLLQNGRANDWQTAYNLAIALNQDLNGRIREEEAGEILEKKRKEAEEAANKAKRAAGVNVKTSGIVKPSESHGSWTDTLSMAADRLMGA